MTEGSGPDILFEVRGAAGLVTLNRPRALNALTLAMADAMLAQLDAWAADDAVTRVVVRGAGGRAFCAGGDIRQIYELGREGRLDEVSAFWTAEYRLDAAIRAYPKPYVSLIEGIVMGGGVGISLHGSHRVAAENYSFAMPEVGIGFFPDCGTTYALPRLPDQAGTYLALTGNRIGASDALALGLATHYSPAAKFDTILDLLCEGGDVDASLSPHTAQAPAPGPLRTQRALMATAFSADTVSEILVRLDRMAPDSAFAAETASLMRTRSPTSLCIAREQMRRGAVSSFEEAQRLEYRLAVRATEGGDFYEGVRAAIVDKDGKPAWSPATLAEVDPDAIAARFGPLEQPEPVIGPEWTGPLS
ncbi:MAG: enoyl-CoA hydratase/isomerase family protein [Methylobacterium sp.]|uniref:enoyl-CoA hydratase/isomerase family protein n=1 Tax=Methylobacterium sp. TaxID=409 RepID=UPI0026011093|nr:enoyl-CoA hydratase/isomerase family protein [Methylobacterium sp.]MBX9934765.1 enoyl-CoA hydratase/isomerase family protein [Methylobacterium sp.]